MIIRKKLVNKYYSEKLYSTGNDNLDSLLEKAFCDGYEYAQREFNEEDNKKEKKNKKLRFGDKIELNRLKSVYGLGKFGDKIKEAHLNEISDDEDERNLGHKKLAKQGLKYGSVVVPAAAALGYGASRLVNKDSRKDALKVAGLGAAAGALGTGIGIGTNYITGKIQDKRLNKGKKDALKTRDRVKVAAGEMSKDEFIEKWGK